MITKELTFNELTSNMDYFTGTENWFKVSPFSELLMTDGVKYFADKCSCHWIISDFMTQVYKIMSINGYWFSSITLEVTRTHMVKMSAVQDKGEPVFWHKQQKDYMACIPVGTYTLWIECGVILLPSEH